MARRRQNHPSEAEARAINAAPWKPLPGMYKRRCERCAYLFACPSRFGSAVCLDCQLLERQGRAFGEPQRDEAP